MHPDTTYLSIPLHVSSVLTSALSLTMHPLPKTKQN